MKEKLLIGNRYRSRIENYLDTLGISVFWLPDNPFIDERLAAHADLSAVKLDNKKIVIAKGLADERKLVNYLTNEGVLVILSEKAQAAVYPGDINLCACILGSTIIHCEKYTDPAVMKNINATVINVNQGYTKCSVCIVDDNSIITSDKVIAEKAKSSGIDVLKISEGNIDLEGYDYGFIGGASISLKDKILFTGDPDKHPDGLQIRRFIESRNKDVVAMSDGGLFDIGGAVVL